MKSRHVIFCFFFCLLTGTGLFFAGNARALEWDYSGRLSGWITETTDHDSWQNSLGLLYIPQVSLKKYLGEESFLDAEVSVKGFGMVMSEESEEDLSLKLYRAKLRYATAQTETRLGLQKINFGPARLLRPLRWFDRLDPSDPLQLTDGVYALRFKYNALNNSNFWLWSLYGNDEPKGYEIFSTVSDSAEFGGRLQHPVPLGELAASFHTRKVDGSSFNIPNYTENRFALDGRWDIGVGLWFESVFQHQSTAVIPNDWTKLITAGLDYTFGIGSGLYFLLEHMATAFSDEALGWDEAVHVSAVMLNYPVTLTDNLTAIGYYSWDRKKYYQYLSWQRTYDYLILNLSLFYYPRTGGQSLGLDQNFFEGGYGARFMIIFNH
ncbi:MAG: hypothetical protein JRJ73_11245 [Deltaproteobacteria bacterium]|nr:hypothetical protein [Deltaproteobacteria bacterium]MBW2052108.1 hypothetical protein [Deltaproteobacteria bacterium]